MGCILQQDRSIWEKMTLFWHDHFATSVQKVKEPALLFDQNVTFRKHALGNFKKLTLAMAQDPAMMLYLDLQTSKKGKPNENFAREVMELFTMGRGHYTENDVKEARFSTLQKIVELGLGGHLELSIKI